MDADIVISGAGPAGCAAAYDLAQAGRRVLLLERALNKPPAVCGGGLTIKALQALRFEIHPVIERFCDTMAVSLNLRRPADLTCRRPVVAMIRRRCFDDYCRERARSAGATLADDCRLLGIQTVGSGLLVDTSRGAVRTRFLIGADGVNSRVRRLTGAGPSLIKGFAVRGRAPLEGRPLPGMAFDFGIVPWGYGWVFSKRDHLNIGLFTGSPTVKLDAAGLIRYARRRIGADVRLSGVRGRAISTGGWRYRPRHHRILLAGDAAGMVEPLLGEGIHNAITTGQLAAQAVETALNDGHYRAGAIYHRLLGEMRRELGRCRVAAGFFYGCLPLGYRLLTAAPIGRAFMKTTAMGRPISTAGSVLLRPGPH